MFTSIKPFPYITFLFIISTLLLSGQQGSLTLAFTAIDSTEWVEFDSIRITNISRNCDTVLAYPDTLLVLDHFVNIPEGNAAWNPSGILQNFPNPSMGQVNVSLNMPETSPVRIVTTDVLGKILVMEERILDKGKHTFLYSPPEGGLYFLVARFKGQSHATRILDLSFRGAGKNSLFYLGRDPSVIPVKDSKKTRSFLFAPGDTLLYVCYDDTLGSGMSDAPVNDSTYTFQFAYDIPCPGTPWVSHGGSVYYTVQIFNQCWLERNPEIGTIIPASREMTDNDTIEKYCYDDNYENCLQYGGLYQWDEMMDYASAPGSQGICPGGWHVPTDEEIKILSGSVDSQHGIGDTTEDMGWTVQYPGNRVVVLDILILQYQLGMV